MAKKNKPKPQVEKRDSARPLLSVCMIVKDEEANLERCLRSVQPVANEIVVVDTGSRDRTVEIARRCGAKVSDFQWCDDFAAARNAALDEATGRWVLQMDADEELASESARHVRKLVSSAPPECWGFFIPVHCYTIADGIKQSTIIYRLLLFRNHKDMRYLSRIHEYVNYVGDGRQPDFKYEDALVVEHYGYLPEQMATKAKLERNLRLLLLAVDESPDDPYHQFNLGQHYFYMDRPLEAVAPLRRAIELCDNPATPYLCSAYTVLVTALTRAGRGNEVAATVAEAEARLPVLTADFCWQSGLALSEIGQVDQAMSYFQRAMKVGSVRLAANSNPGAGTWLPRFSMGLLYEGRGELGRARALYDEALAFVPEHPGLNRRLAILAQQLGEPARALECVKRVVPLEHVSDEVYWDLLAVCERLADSVSAGKAELADLEAVAGELVQRVPITSERGEQLSTACIRFGQWARGIAAATASLENAKSVVALSNRGVCHFRLGRYREAADDFGMASEAHPGDPNVLANLQIAQQLANEAPGTGGGRDHVQSGYDNPAAAPSLDNVCSVLRRQEECYDWIRGKWRVATRPRPEAQIPSPKKNRFLASIVIPVSGDEERTRRCFEAIVGNTPEDLYELVVVDNGSSDGTKDFLKLLDGDVRIIANATDVGFPDACQQGAEVASGKYVVFLNDQAEPQRGWLSSLIASVQGDSSWAPIDCQLVYPRGAPDEAGAIMARSHSMVPSANQRVAPGYHEFSRPEVQAIVPISAKRILDVGCAAGALGQGLKARQVCEVTGIECVPEVAEIARQRLDRVYFGDVIDVAESLPEAHFDCIVMADVLEHLPDPTEALRLLKRSLAPDGRIVLSVPNVRHWSVVRDLLEGRWDYAEAGLLDRSHLRFFTRASVEQQLHAVGLSASFEGATSVNGEGIPPSVIDALHAEGLEVTTLSHESSIYQFLYVAEPIREIPDTALTSIIILARNQLDLTRECLASIERHTPEKHELVIVDNGSTDGTNEFLMDFAARRNNVRVIANEANRGFAAGNNQGIAVARGEHILLLNNDTVVTQGWLGRMLSVFERHPKVGLVGPMSNYVSGPQLARGIQYGSIAEMETLAKRWAMDHSEQSLPFPRVVGFCLLAKRAVVDRIGGLDERFGTGNYEDDDYCVRSALAGFQVRIAQDVFIHHSGSQTFKGSGIDFRQAMSRNWEIFKEKWRIPPAAPIEQGYSVPYDLRDTIELYFPLPEVQGGAIQMSDPRRAPAMVG